ncbi:MAG TPA: hypothetical protein VFA84_13185 [Acidimicrobiales bacterium]|nr:hypothetical protein [Acidimicrobiales bacterium]
MTSEEFLTILRSLTADMILAASVDLEEHAASAAGEVAWWRATVEIDRLLRLNRSGRVAARVASQAAATVATAAVAAGLDRADPRVMSVARAAADVARGLAAQSSAVDDLLAGCRHLVAA